MATINRFEKKTIRQDNPQFSMLKTLIETAIYGNNVQAIDNLDQAYQLASSAPNTIILDQTIAKAQELGLAEDTKVLVANGGAVVGRTAKARRLWGQDSEEDKKIAAILREELYQSSFLPFISGKAVVGLDQQFIM